MRLSERHSRIRAHDDEDTMRAALAFVRDHFGGDWERAAWYFDECGIIDRMGGTPQDNIFSVKTKTMRPIHLRSKQ